MSADSGYSSSPSSELPSSSFDGSHLNYKAFRQFVLSSHNIQVLETVHKERLPESLLASIEASIKASARFDSHKTAFREQVATGQGFRSLPLFPQDLLPATNQDSRLTRSSDPAFSRDLLPPQCQKRLGRLYKLSVPRSALACGFSATALSTEEISVLPSHLMSTGSSVNLGTGYVPSGAAVYCPFLTFERASGVKEHQIEAANNRCAIAGAWCVRALQILFAQAWNGETTTKMPIAFSCTIETSFAIVNFHWISNNQSYCMAPLCKFDLNKDDHFLKFLSWVDAINKWSLDHLLPTIKEALQCLWTTEPMPPIPSSEKYEERDKALTIETRSVSGGRLFQPIKTTFDTSPVCEEDDDCTPISSSTASWGSPIVADFTFAYTVPNTSQSADTGITAAKRRMMLMKNYAHPSPPPAYQHNTELVWEKRLTHATEEIHELQQQVHLLRGGLQDLHRQLGTELSTVKTTVASVLRKETLVLRSRSTSAGAGLGLNLASSSAAAGQEQPSPPSPRSFSSRPLATIPSSLIVNTKPLVFSPIPTRSWEQQIPNPNNHPLPSPSSRSSPPIPPTPLIPQTPYTPTPVTAISQPLSAAFPRTPFSPAFSTVTSIHAPKAVSVTTPSPSFGLTAASLAKWTAITFSAHTLARLIPFMGLRVIVLGCITEAAMLACASPGWAAGWGRLWEVVWS